MPVLTSVQLRVFDYLAGFLLQPNSERYLSHSGSPEGKK